jgi:aminoglycoside N3'-acetyltransferase
MTPTGPPASASSASPASTALPGWKVTSETLQQGLREVGLARGDVVYVASSLAALGLMANPVGETLAALRAVIGREGTLVMPAFNFDFCEGHSFDRERSPSRTGVLSEAFRQQPDAQRSWSPPFHSVTAAGPRAAELIAGEALTSFGRDSVFQRLHDIGAKQLLIGCGFHEGVVHVHWLEETVEVPYRHWKRFEGEVIRDGVKQRRTFFMYARSARPKVTLDAGPLGVAFAETGAIRATTVGLCRLQAFALADFARFAQPRLEENPLLLVAEDDRPRFARAGSPVRGIDHIGLVSRYADRLRDFFGSIDCRLAAEGAVAELGVRCEYFSGLDVTIEFVEPTAVDSRVAQHAERYPGCPLHHIAFAVDDLDAALPYFKARGYEPLDGRWHLGPKPFQRVLFLSPIQTGGLLVELVADDGRKASAYGGSL